jgi:hypothetical protein
MKKEDREKAEIELEADSEWTDQVTELAVRACDKGSLSDGQLRVYVYVVAKATDGELRLSDDEIGAGTNKSPAYVAKALAACCGQGMLRVEGEGEGRLIRTVASPGA